MLRDSPEGNLQNDGKQYDHVHKDNHFRETVIAAAVSGIGRRLSESKNLFLGKAARFGYRRNGDIFFA